MKNIVSYNPHDQSVVGETRISTLKEVELAVQKAKSTYSHWRYASVAKRASYIDKYHQLLLDHQEPLATLISQEVGKPISQSRDEIKAELEFVKWYAEHAEEALKERTLKETETNVYKIIYEPWGVCASIAPWNFPVTMASSGILQQILAGNTVVFKPSELSTLSQKYFIDLLNKTGLPEGVVSYVIGAEEVGKHLIDQDIQLVWFTGSTQVGRSIYAKCGQKFIRSIMELGGNSPGIVFADCDIEKTLEQLYWARFLNAGQVCNAVKRLLVEKSIYPAILKGLIDRLAKLKMDDPLTDPDIGPLVSPQQLKQTISQVEDARAKGGGIEIGGSRSKNKELRKGNYYLPTIITHVKDNMRLLTEETFGPVLPVIPFETEAEVINLANRSEYGLSAEIYTSDINKANRIARLLEAGVIGINTCNYFVPFCPAGGYKKSGMGREYGTEGFQELSQIKYTCIAK